jgi:hypothetical protein
MPWPVRVLAILIAAVMLLAYPIPRIVKMVRSERKKSDEKTGPAVVVHNHMAVPAPRPPIVAKHVANDEKRRPSVREEEWRVEQERRTREESDRLQFESLSDRARKRMAAERAISVVAALPDKLLHIFEEHTNVQAQRMLDVYVGQYIVVTGFLNDISGRLETAMQLNTDTLEIATSETEVFTLVLDVATRRIQSAYVMGRFEADWKSRLAVLQKGAILTVFGKIEKIDRFFMRLSNAEIV